MENPLNDLMQIFGFELETQHWLDLRYKGDLVKGHSLSIYPEYSSIDRNVLKFNCAIQRNGSNHHFIEFTDEIEFYEFLSNYDPELDYDAEERNFLINLGGN